MTLGHRPTLADVAKAVGVHTSTASRALSADPAVRSTVSTAVAEAVARAASELGYAPNRLGASLRTGKSNTLGVLLPHTSDWVVGAVYEGLDAGAAAFGYSTFLANTFDDPDVRRERMSALAQFGVDAVLYADIAADAEDLPNIGSIPCLPFLRRGLSDHGRRIDDELGGRLIARHLIEQGYTDAAVVAGPLMASTFAARVGGFRDEFSALGGEVLDAEVAAADASVESGKAAAAELFASARPSAVFAVHDPLALGVYLAAAERRMRIGPEIGIVGYNDVEMSAQLPVPLTTVRWDPWRFGHVVARNVIAELEGRTPGAVPPEPVLIPRASTQRG